MAAASPPLPDVPAARARPWRLVAVALLAASLLIAGVTAFWYVTGTGPFSRVEPSTWAFTMTQVSDLQARGADGTGVRVCLVDTGVDLTHPDLRHVRLLAWRDFVHAPPLPDPYDDVGHGTAMAGILFAQGVLHGVAPQAGLIAVKAIAKSGSGSDGDIASAITFCLDPNGNGDSADDGAMVISLSLGGANHPILGSQTTAAANAAVGRGVFVVAAAGNDGQDDDGDVESPASEPDVIAVGAVDRSGVIAPFSSIGSATWQGFSRTEPNKKPEVVAPGLEIAATWTGGQYAYVSGTSPAAAFVSGVVALLLQNHPQYRQNPSLFGQFKTEIMDGAMPQAGQQRPHDPRYGYGLVRAVATDALL